jgi:putative ABC transport system permease protein
MIGDDIMLKNYVKIALRNLYRQRLYVTINIFGLAIGLAVCLLIIGLINNDLNFEKCHSLKDRIYRVDGTYQIHDSGVSMASIMPAVGPAIREEMPEVEQAVRIRRLWDIPVEFDENTSIIESKAFSAEPALFDVFTIPLIEGNPESALSDPFSVVISEKIKKQYFGNTSPLGRSIKMNNEHLMQITGVSKDLPPNTQIRSNFIVSYATLEKIGENTDSWTDLFQDYTYLLLKENASASDLEQKIPAMLERHLDPEEAKRYQLKLQPLEDIFLYSNLSYELPPQGELTKIYVFGSIAFIILIIACINFVNLTTSRVSRRSKEVGVRKAVGAGRRQLIIQFISESLILAALSMLLGLAIFEMAVPLLKTYIERDLVINVLTDPVLIFSIIGMVLAVGILSGSYPAFILSRYLPSEVFSGGSSGRGAGSLHRRILVVFQFTAAIILICITLSIYRQINFALTTDLGFDRENMMLLNLEGSITYEQSRVLKNIINNDRIAISATIVDNVPGEGRHYLWSLRPESKPEEDPTFLHGIRADSDFLRTFDLEIIEGNAPQEQISSIPTEQILINETAVSEFGIENPIGFKFLLGESELEVCGVIKDFHVHSLKNQIMPTMIVQDTSNFRLMAVKLPAGNIPGSVSRIKEVWETIVPAAPFDYKFLQDAIGERYEEEQKVGQLFIVFSFLAVIVACLGLFGLATFAAEQKTKEVGIRKVLGASISNIIAILARQFIFLVIISNILAWPPAYFLIDYYLSNFAYRVEIGILVFIVSGLLAFIVAILSICFQSIKAASANPVKALRYE